MKKIVFLITLISCFTIKAQTMPQSIQDAINSICCGGSSSNSVVYVDSIYTSLTKDTLFWKKNGITYSNPLATGGGITKDRVETQTLTQSASTLTLTTKDTNGVTTTQAFRIGDFWRSSTPVPTVANGMPDNVNDTSEFIQRMSDIFIGGADGLVRAGQGAGNFTTNTVFSKNGLSSNTTGQNNTAVGASALNLNTTGNNNSALGTEALKKNNGSNNSAFGYASLYDNTTGFWNTSMGGANTMRYNTTGYENSAYGTSSLQYNISGIRNSAFGVISLQYCTASDNCAFGYASGAALSSGTMNNLFGKAAASGLTTGSDNCVFGSGNNQAGRFLASGSGNTLMGNNSSNRLSGSNNTIMGYFAGDVGNASDNVMIGFNCFGPSFLNWTSPSAVATTGNTFVGSNINKSSNSQIAIGNNNSALGNNINMRVVGITNSTAIGANAISDASNQIQIGDANVTQLRTFGAVVFQKTYTDASVPNNSLYVDSSTGKLMFKDGSGVANPLY